MSEQPPAPTRRVFLALPLDDATRAALADAASRMAKGAHFTPARITWVAPENLHLTMHFLGSVPVAMVERLAASVRDSLRGCAPFELDVRGIGYFPHQSAPKVLWAGVPRPPDALGALHRRLAELVERIGIRLLHDNFHPHVTLARFKSLKGTAAFVRQASLFRDRAFGRVRIERVHLMESVLGPSGPTYAVLEEGRLKAEG